MLKLKGGINMKKILIVLVALVLGSNALAYKYSITNNLGYATTVSIKPTLGKSQEVKIPAGATSTVKFTGINCLNRESIKVDGDDPTISFRPTSTAEAAGVIFSAGVSLYCGDKDIIINYDAENNQPSVEVIT